MKMRSEAVKWRDLENPLPDARFLAIITLINVKKTYQFKTQCKDDVMISDI